MSWELTATDDDDDDDDDDDEFEFEFEFEFYCPLLFYQLGQEKNSQKENKMQKIKERQK